MDLKRLSQLVLEGLDENITTHDIGELVTITSPVPINVSGRWCDIFEGHHATEGRVALKRPRLSRNELDQEVKRVR